MFTGLVQHVGTIADRRDSAAGASLVVAVGAWPSEGTPADAPLAAASHPPLALGESISVSGCCLTLARIGSPVNGPAHERWLGFDVIPQTLRVTGLGRLAIGHRVNLERSATPMTLMGGHIVQGHVDGLGRVVAVTGGAVTGGSGEWRVRIEPPRELLRYLCDKGSIAVDGVSLTVAAIDDAAGTFDVCLIPETLARTTLGDRRAGDDVHLEVDCLAKMLARLLPPR